MLNTLFRFADLLHRKHQSPTSLAFERGIHQDVDSPHKGPVMWKMFPFDEVIMTQSCLESQIINIKLEKNQQKVPGPPPKFSALDWQTCGNFQHWTQHKYSYISHSNTSSGVSNVYTIYHYAEYKYSCVKVSTDMWNNVFTLESGSLRIAQHLPGSSLEASSQFEAHLQ